MIISNNFKADYIFDTCSWEISPVFHLVAEGGRVFIKRLLKGIFVVSDFTLTVVRLNLLYEFIFYFLTP